MVLSVKWRPLIPLNQKTDYLYPDGFIFFFFYSSLEVSIASSSLSSYHSLWCVFVSVFCGASSEVFSCWVVINHASAQCSSQCNIVHRKSFHVHFYYYVLPKVNTFRLITQDSNIWTVSNDFLIQFMQIWTAGDWIIEAQNIIDLLCASVEPERVKKFSSFFLWHQHELGNCWSCKNSISAFANTFIYWSCRWLIYYHFLVSC